MLALVWLKLNGNLKYKSLPNPATIFFKTLSDLWHNIRLNLNLMPCAILRMMLIPSMRSKTFLGIFLPMRPNIASCLKNFVCILAPFWRRSCFHRLETLLIYSPKWIKKIRRLPITKARKTLHLMISLISGQNVLMPKTKTNSLTPNPAVKSKYAVCWRG